MELDLQSVGCQSTHGLLKFDITFNSFTSRDTVTATRHMLHTVLSSLFSWKSSFKTPGWLW